MASGQPRRLAYFPGCMSLDCSREMDISLRAVFAALDVQLVELPDWNCCGGDLADSMGSTVARALAMRILTQAAQVADELVCACPVCVGHLSGFGDGVRVRSALEVLAEPHLLSLIEERRAERLEGMKAVCYTGPVSNASTGETSSTGPALEKVVRTCGLATVKWPGRRKPHGGTSVFTRPELMRALAAKVLTDAIDAGADLIVLDDPHAQLNLDLFQYPIGRERKRAFEIPVLFAGELVAHVLGLDAAESCYRRHMTSPLGLFLDYYDRQFAVMSKKAPDESKP